MTRNPNSVLLKRVTLNVDKILPKEMVEKEHVPVQGLILMLLFSRIQFCYVMDQKQ